MLDQNKDSQSQDSLPEKVIVGVFEWTCSYVGALFFGCIAIGIIIASSADAPARHATAATISRSAASPLP